MTHIVKCKYCGQTFDTDTFYNYTHDKETKRYWHDECKERADTSAKKDVEDRERIHEKAKEVLGSSYIKSKIDRQINEFLADGKKLSGIYGCLVYWYDKMGNTSDGAHGGIGIVPHIYAEATEYFRRKSENKKRYKGVTDEQVDGYVNQPASRVCERKISFKSQNISSTLSLIKGGV